MFALVAIVLFMLAAFGVNNNDVNIVDIGLACLAAHLLVGLWPFGTVFARRE